MNTGGEVARKMGWRIISRYIPPAKQARPVMFRSLQCSGVEWPTVAGAQLHDMQYETTIYSPSQGYPQTFYNESRQSCS